MANIKLYLNNLSAISKSFIIANIFDIISTIFAISQGGVETNIIVVHCGWITGIFVKIFSVFLFVYILEKCSEYKLYWMIPITVWIVVGWNFFFGLYLMIK
jgi:hypothetical protein